MQRTAIATIDLGALRHNLSIVKRFSPQSRILAVIKANAYGHGLLPIAKALLGVDGFAVSCLAEALALREITEQRIVVLQGFHSGDEIEAFSKYSIDPVIHQQWQLDAVLQNESLQKSLNIWVKLDTGMHRLGLNADELETGLLDSLSVLQKHPQVNDVHLMTHMACADNRADKFTNQQIERFKRLIYQTSLPCSIANSATLVGWDDTRLEWSRPGIMLYGVNPFDNGIGEDLDLKPVMTLRTRLIAIKNCQSGDAVGYGGQWVCPKATTIGVAAIGYGDGYPRHAVNGTPVLVNGQRCSIVGRVSMDMITIDMTNAAHASIGDEVVLWGEGLPIEKIAECSSTIAYELLCGVYGRVNYMYKNEENT